jgi:hypothetical protein
MLTIQSNSIIMFFIFTKIWAEILLDSVRKSQMSNPYRESQIDQEKIDTEKVGQDRDALVIKVISGLYEIIRYLLS